MKFATCNCPVGMKYHANNCPTQPGQPQNLPQWASSGADDARALKHLADACHKFGGDIRAVIEGRA